MPQKTNMAKLKQFIAHRMAGMTCEEAAALVGVTPRCGYKWQGHAEYNRIVDELASDTKSKMWRVQAWREVQKQLYSEDEDKRWRAAVMIIERLEGKQPDVAVQVNIQNNDYSHMTVEDVLRENERIMLIEEAKTKALPAMNDLEEDDE